MKNIIKSLYKDEEKFNKEAVELARQNKGKINDYLLEELEKINKDIDDNKIEYVPLFFAYDVYLLAEFKEKRLYPLLMTLLNKPDIHSFEFFGMGVMDKLPNIVVSTFDGDFEPINKVIENKKVDEYTRSRLLASYAYFYDHNLITKEDLEKYLKKLIKLYNYEDDGFYCAILDLIIHAKLFNMIEDVKIMFHEDAIDIHYRGAYDSFIDDLFDYNQKETVNEVEDIVKEMSWWACFNNEDKQIDTKKLTEGITNLFKQDLDNNLDLYNKVGRNDPCPCGSGKKYKKCCIDKKKETLPYQSYIDKSLNDYPKKNTNKDEIDFYTYYNQEYIEIDKLLYKALKYNQIPVFVKRDKKSEETMDYNALNEAFDLIKEVLNKQKFKNIDEYDKKISIHYSLYTFFQKYSELILNKANENKTKYLPKLEELLNIFYQNFDLNNESEVLFLDRINAFYILSKRNSDGIKYFEDKLNNSKYNRYDIYGYLFDQYMSYYDYDTAKSKIETAISNEKDKKLVKELEELKVEFLEDEEDYFY